MPRTTHCTSAAASVARAQIPLPLGKPKGGADVEAVTVGRRSVMVRFVRNLRSRRYVLRVLPDDTVRLTVPRLGSRSQALVFLRRELPWVERQRYAVARQAGVVLFRGALFPLETYVDGRSDRRFVRFGPESVIMRRGETARAAACRRLRDLAGVELGQCLAPLAARFGLTVRRTTIRSQLTRWGSCSPDGRIALNWRLMQMPDSVRDYILIHELMHLKEPNHSRRFWALVEHACPDYKAALRWLKAHEGELL